eukprot:2004942-Rhodomonas_salina.1
MSLLSYESYAFFTRYFVTGLGSSTTDLAILTQESCCRYSGTDEGYSATRQHRSYAGSSQHEVPHHGCFDGIVGSGDFPQTWMLDFKRWAYDDEREEFVVT